MSDAYLPGLTVSEATIIRKVRRLPLKGEVLVERGMRVEPETVVARTFIPGRPHLVPVANLLNIEPAEVEEVMLKAVGDPGGGREVIARYSAFFGLFRGQCQSPAAGTIEHISPSPARLPSASRRCRWRSKHIFPGVVTEILPREGVVVETPRRTGPGHFRHRRRGLRPVADGGETTRRSPHRPAHPGRRPGPDPAVAGRWSPPKPCAGPRKQA